MISISDRHRFFPGVQNYNTSRQIVSSNFIYTLNVSNIIDTYKKNISIDRPDEKTLFVHTLRVQVSSYTNTWRKYQRVPNNISIL